jgi:hypothetical protein
MACHDDPRAQAAPVAARGHPNRSRRNRGWTSGRAAPSHPCSMAADTEPWNSGAVYEAGSGRIAGRCETRRVLTHCRVFSRVEDDFRPHISPPGLGCRSISQRSIFGAREHR